MTTNQREWQVIDGQTGAARKQTYETFGKANRAAERLNQAYGAVRYGARLQAKPAVDSVIRKES